MASAAWSYERQALPVKTSLASKDHGKEVTEYLGLFILDLFHRNLKNTEKSMSTLYLNFNQEPVLGV